MQSRCLKKHITVEQFVTTNYIPNYEEGHIGLCRIWIPYTRYMVFGENKPGPQGFRVGEPLRIALANDFFRPIDNLYGVMELQPGQVNWGSVNSQPLPGAVRLWLWSVFREAAGSCALIVTDNLCTERSNTTTASLVPMA